MKQIFKYSENEKLKDYIGEEIYNRQLSRRHICVPIENDGFYMSFVWCDIKNIHKKCERQAIYCSDKDIVFFSTGSHCSEIARSLTEGKSNFDSLAEFFYNLTLDDIDCLEKFETNISELETGILTSSKPVEAASARIVEMRRSLMKLKRYYEQLQMIVDVLNENRNNSIPETSLKLFERLSHYIEYLLKSVVDMREYVTQVREAYQAQVDIEQNNIMKVFTVMTTIFLPLTLIAGWYGMNLKMPESDWDYGYLFVILLSLLVCGACVIVFKRKKWF